MKNKLEQVYQFKLSMKGITPQIWRRIQVPGNCTLKDPSHSEYEDTIEWLGEDFDPEHFDPKDVSF